MRSKMTVQCCELAVDGVETTHNSDREPGATELQEASILTMVADVNMDNSNERAPAANTCKDTS